MTDDPYRQIFLDLKADLSYLARKHGGRLLEQATKDATQSRVLRRLAEDITRRTEQSDGEPEDIPPEELEYPDETVLDVPPAPEDEESKSGNEDEEDPGEEDDTDEEQTEGEDPGEHELSDAAERVLDRLMDGLESRAEK
ncbi:hypothetical protein [Salinibacter sp.]|uniref:hypothetical protein n=1 Tax=Salinibacter sp. TaxID=2065818 RepID=UPI0021E6F6C0|nr:hypothetical protein [Salinibacter sp.]